MNEHEIPTSLYSNPSRQSHLLFFQTKGTTSDQHGFNNLLRPKRKLKPPPSSTLTNSTFPNTFLFIFVFLFVCCIFLLFPFCFFYSFFLYFLQLICSFSSFLFILLFSLLCFCFSSFFIFSLFSYFLLYLHWFHNASFFLLRLICQRFHFEFCNYDFFLCFLFLFGSISPLSFPLCCCFSFFIQVYISPFFHSMTFSFSVSALFFFLFYLITNSALDWQSLWPILRERKKKDHEWGR